jgi:threonine dehydrogenase-like Zn-dependent dehydrogenase
LSGLSTHCRNRTVLGILNRDGAFADFVKLPAQNLHVLPKTVDDDAAAFVEPLAAAYQVLKQVQVDAKKWVTVLGDGRLGLLVAQVLRDAGCPVRVIGKHPDKLALCEKWSIRSRPLADIKPRHDQDVVVDCTGTAAGIELALQMVRPRGTVVLKSTAAAGKPLNLAPVVIDEINIVGSRCGPFREAIKALAEKRIDVTSLIHRRMKIEQGVEAMELAGRPGVLKVLLTME